MGYCTCLCTNMDFITHNHCELLLLLSVYMDGYVHPSHGIKLNCMHEKARLSCDGISLVVANLDGVLSV